MPIKRPDIDQIRQTALLQAEEYGEITFDFWQLQELFDYIEAVETERDRLKDAVRRNGNEPEYVAWALLWKYAAKGWYLTARGLDEALTIVVQSKEWPFTE